jgi:transposase-like protein
LLEGRRQTIPGQKASVLEGLDETLTVIELGLPKTLRQSLQTTNVIESALSIAEDVARNVKRWRNSNMALRWMATGFVEAEKRFKRIRGYREIPLLLQSLNKDKELSGREEVA